MNYHIFCNVSVNTPKKYNLRIKAVQIYYQVETLCIILSYVHESPKTQVINK